MKKSYRIGITRYGWIVLACMLIAAIAGVAMLKVQKQVFQVSSTMYVVADTPSNGFNTTLATNDSIALANNYATEIMSRTIMDYPLISITVRPRIWPARICSPNSNILLSGST